MKEYKIESNWKTPIVVNWVKSESGMSDSEFRNWFGVGQTEIEAAMDGRDTLREWHLTAIAKYFGLSNAQLCGTEAM